ncbi:uncharacterized protein ptx4 [Genypterus blacodes]|uniref:uncharacterized protein ptx4 n=1 Tax=Genypterus blacodes TaxID=154954 RepID=UPI003F764ECD
MGGLRLGQWPLILVHMLLLHPQPLRVQGGDPLSQRVRRLNEQFQQFQVLTQARLDMLALNQNRNWSQALEGRVQALTDQYHRFSEDLDHLKVSMTQETEGLREWSRKLEKKSKRMEGRLALMERNLRESIRRHTQKQKPEQDFSNLTLELQNHEDRLAALQAQRDELVIGLKGMQNSLQKQELHMTQMEGQLSRVLQGNEGGSGNPTTANTAHRGYYHPHRRNLPPGRMLGGHSLARSEDTNYSQIIHSQPPPGDRAPLQPDPHQETPNQPKPSKKARPQPGSHSHTQTTDVQSRPHQPHRQQHFRPPTQTRPYQEQNHPLQPRQPASHHHSPIQQPSQVHSHPHQQSHIISTGSKDRQMRGRSGTPQPLTHAYPPQRSEGKDDSDAEADASAVQNFLQLPLRHKIPVQPVTKKTATICNVDSMLFFPSSSVENYVTFSRSLPGLPELSVCLWLRVESAHIGTLLSYATDDNDNQLVLYGSSSSSASHNSSSSSLSPSLDFVIGDPVYRRLPAAAFLDARWHHLCVLWSSIQGHLWHYTDRRLISSGSNFQKGWEVPGGGSVVLGQEQDTVGGGFDPAEGFVGRVAGFRVWNRVLSPSEVRGVAEGRGVPRGVVLSMEDIKKVHGEVQQVACECLERCV